MDFLGSPTEILVLKIMYGLVLRQLSPREQPVHADFDSPLSLKGSRRKRDGAPVVSNGTRDLG